MKIELTYKDIYNLIVAEREKCERYEDALTEISQAYPESSHIKSLADARFLAQDALEER